MPKINLSRYFLSSHPKKRQSTFFVPKVLNSLDLDLIIVFYEIKARYGFEVTPQTPNPFTPEQYKMIWDILTENIPDSEPQAKHHTIRKHKKKHQKGDKLSLSFWLGKPYRGRQVVFWEGEIDEVYDIGIDSVANEIIGISDSESTDIAICNNDGLTFDDFFNWFYNPTQKQKNEEEETEIIYTGQVICWCDPKY